MKRLPNLISCLRIVLSVSLLFLTNLPVGFAIIYFICGVSDIMDGYLARRWGAQSSLGAKLDSAGDFIFYAVLLFILLSFLDNENSGLTIICVLMVTIIRMGNLVMTKLKFKQWSVIHTFGSKFTGFMLFLTLPVCFFADGISYWNIIVVGIIAALSSLEESIILLKSKIYDADRRSIFS